MRCTDLLKALNDYLDNEAEPHVRDEIRRHLDGCAPCNVVVDNVRKTITIYKAGHSYELPQEFSDRLREALRARWQARYAPCR